MTVPFIICTHNIASSVREATKYQFDKIEKYLNEINNEP